MQGCRLRFPVPFTGGYLPILVSQEVSIPPITPAAVRVNTPRFHADFLDFWRLVENFPRERSFLPPRGRRSTRRPRQGSLSNRQVERPAPLLPDGPGCPAPPSRPEFHDLRRVRPAGTTRRWQKGSPRTFWRHAVGWPETFGIRTLNGRSAACAFSRAGRPMPEPAMAPKVSRANFSKPPVRPPRRGASTSRPPSPRRPIKPLSIPHRHHHLPRRHQCRQQFFQGVGRKTGEPTKIVPRHPRRPGPGNGQRQRRRIGNFLKTMVEPSVEGLHEEYGIVGE